MNSKHTALILAPAILVAACSTTRPDGVTRNEPIQRSRTGAADLPRLEGYATAASTSAPKVVLLHGTDAQAQSWRPHFYEPLVDAGFCVIRLDLRDNGLSERFGKPEGFEPEGWTPEQAPPYPLEDMAADVAQLVAIREPAMVSSLTLLATTPSNTFDEEIGMPADEMIEWFKDTAPKLGMSAAFMPFTRGRTQDLLMQFHQKIDPDFASPAGEQVLDAYVREISTGERAPNPMSWQGMALVTSPSRAAATTSPWASTPPTSAISSRTSRLRRAEASPRRRP